MDISIGNKYRDVLTGVEGTCVGIGRFQNSGDEALLQPFGLKEDGSAKEKAWVNANNLEAV